jgi:hypothetical protein
MIAFLETETFIAAMRHYRACGGDVPVLPDTLLTALGCSHLHSRDDANPDWITPAKSDYDATIVQQVLPGLLVELTNVDKWDRLTSDSITSLFYGCDRCDCLSACLDTPSSAYALAAGVCGFLSIFSSNYILDDLAVEHVCNLLNVWLKPLVPWTSCPSVNVVASHLFGVDWCVVALPESAGRLGASSVADRTSIIQAITKQRPPFLPGLLPAQIETMSVPLPDDVGMII